jgi:hypothetical protein
LSKFFCAGIFFCCAGIFFLRYFFIFFLAAQPQNAPLFLPLSAAFFFDFQAKK